MSHPSWSRAVAPGACAAAVFCALLISGGAFSAGDSEDPCALKFSNCTACAYDSGGACQWCPAASSCMLVSAFCAPDEAHGAPVSHSSGNCSCTNPTANFHSCASCASAGPACGFGWCPLEEKCYLSAVGGTNPLNHTCTATAANGSYTNAPGSCVCTNPQQSFDSCATCAVPSCNNGWCPQDRACYALNGGGSPIGNTSCPGQSLFLSGLVVDPAGCACENALALRGREDCVGCPHGNYCASTGVCLYSVPEVPLPCSTSQCAPNCVCAPNAGECVLCATGYTNPGSLCVDKCGPNCYDCASSSPNTCITACAVGWTNFPACDQRCPPSCISCGGSWVNSTLPSTQCVFCSDLGAAPPGCDSCLPFVCKGANGTCDTPCNSAAALFPDCDSCQDALGNAEAAALALAAAAFTLPVDATDAAVAAAGVAFADLFCHGAMPPYDTICSVAVVAADAATEGVHVAGSMFSGLAKMLAEGALNKEACSHMHLCPSPSPHPSPLPDPNGNSCALGPCASNEKCCGQMYCVPRDADCCWDSMGLGYCQSDTVDGLVCCEYAMKGYCCRYLYSPCSQCIYLVHEIQRYAAYGNANKFSCGIVLSYAPSWVTGGVCSEVVGYGAAAISSLLQTKSVGWVCQGLFNLCDDNKLGPASARVALPHP